MVTRRRAERPSTPEAAPALEQPAQAPSSLNTLRHNGSLALRRSADGETGAFKRRFCALHGNVLQCYISAAAFEENEEAEATFHVLEAKTWREELGNSNERGLVIHCQGGELVLARADTSIQREEWLEAFAALTALLLEVRDASDDEDEQLDEAYMQQRDELFEPGERTGPATVAFQVSKTKLVRVQAPPAGAFNNGDAYLLMHATFEGENGRGGSSNDVGRGASLTRTLYYWVGSKSSSDKATVACIKAVELRRALGGSCTISREDEGEESPGFLWVCGGELQVVNASTSERALHRVTPVSELSPLMYRVLPRANSVTANGSGKARVPGGGPGFTVHRVKCDEDELVSDRLLLVDDRSGRLYLWCGRFATFKQRGYALEAATSLKADNPRGAQVVQVDEDDEPPELRGLLAAARRQQQEQLLAASAKASGGRPSSADSEEEEEDVEERAWRLAGHAVALFRVTHTEPATSAGEANPNGRQPVQRSRASLQLSLVACTSTEHVADAIGDDLEPEEDGPPSLHMLGGDAAYVLDCYVELFVWYGEQASRAVRLGAVKVANQLRRVVKRPLWADGVVHTRQNQELFLFRVKFSDWSAVPRPNSAALPETFFKAVRTIASAPSEDSADAAVERLAAELRASVTEPLQSAEDRAVAEAGAGEDDGGGELLVWRVTRKGLVALPNNERGHLQSSSSYVMLYGYDADVTEDGGDDGGGGGGGQNLLSDGEEVQSRRSSLFGRQSGGKVTTRDQRRRKRSGLSRDFGSDGEESGSSQDEDAGGDDESQDDDDEENGDEQQDQEEEVQRRSSRSQGRASSPLQQPRRSADPDEASDNDGGGGGGRPRFLMYFWEGARAKKSDWVVWRLELRARMLQQWQQTIGAEVPQVRVEQGREPRHLRLIFEPGRGHGRLVVHDRQFRKRDNPERRVLLFKARAMPDGTHQCFQTPASVAALSSTEAFVCIRTVVTADGGGSCEGDEGVWFWVGRLAPLALQEYASQALTALMEYHRMPSDIPVQILEEADLYDDVADAWEQMAEALGGEASWANFEGCFPAGVDPDDDLAAAGAPRLLLVDSRSGRVGLAPAPASQQDQLGPETVAVLDAAEAAYVWRGACADASTAELVLRAAERYCGARPLAWNRRAVPLRAGSEPLEFRARFQAWDEAAGRAATFRDVYEDRMTKLAAEGRLGDAASLRGRVLADEEATKYWCAEGAVVARGIRGRGGLLASRTAAAAAGLPLTVQQAAHANAISRQPATSARDPLAAAAAAATPPKCAAVPAAPAAAAVREARLSRSSPPGSPERQAKEATALVGASVLVGALDMVTLHESQAAAAAAAAAAAGVTSKGHRRGMLSSSSAAAESSVGASPGPAPEAYRKALASLHSEVDAEGAVLAGDLRAAGVSVLRTSPLSAAGSSVNGGGAASTGGGASAGNRLPWAAAHFPNALAAAAAAAAAAGAAAAAAAAAGAPVSLREAMKFARMQVRSSSVAAANESVVTASNCAAEDPEEEDEDGARRRSKAADARWKERGIKEMVLAEFSSRLSERRAAQEEARASGKPVIAADQDAGVAAVIAYQQKLLQRRQDAAG